MHPRLQGAIVFLFLLDICLRSTFFALLYGNTTLAIGIVFLAGTLGLGYSYSWAPEFGKRVLVFGTMLTVLLSLLSLGILQSREIGRRQGCVNYLRRSALSMRESGALAPNRQPSNVDNSAHFSFLDQIHVTD
ncbi:MAG: hypothetical protein SFU86_06320 [Pirellulaceae bacterium]|nr:hypothetical protein [Pirellulaceae bacterium]